MSAPSYTPRSEITRSAQILRDTFNSGRTRDIAWRRWQLKQLWWLVEDNLDALCLALYADLHRHRTEAVEGDITPLKLDIYEALSNLDTWTKDVNVPGVMGWMTNSRVKKEPLGVVLIISPWNFPLYLALGPMIYAIAAGCTVLLKPSEMTQATERLIVDLIPQYMDQSAIKVITGGPEQIQHTLLHRFDKIFFTGSSKVGKIVAKSAAEHLTPVVLELGGQNPCFVEKDADIDRAAREIARIQFFNSGQFCLCVNHVFADPAIAAELVAGIKKHLAIFLSRGDECMSRIINESNFDRIVNMLNKTSGRVVYGGQHNRSDLYIQPTIVDDVKMNDSLLSCEVFGPVLPIIHATPLEGVNFANKYPSPLALYIFTKSRDTVEFIVNSTMSGGVTVNSLAIHAFVANAPFGGVRESGTGAYHGVYGVDTFSNFRTVATVPGWYSRFFGSSEPPYEDEPQKGKMLDWPSNIGFKRGETLEDQRKKQYLAGRTVKTGLVMAVLGTVLARTGTLGRIWQEIARLTR
ncbi:Aldehyde dehydrogenase NAD(P)-dependent [Ascosphaera apis ARSEF 7405]|uniref:Aldehyde dehydrogenase n=1 Tax=Ascosphaera apis ARSEF 7405 TaxID=392613 RepID=A0A167X454_9EURO|nr:Aldehyde dehydrogenase NAD(P)-dependent [Ascosphaera apis ARSEF 7405]